MRHGECLRQHRQFGRTVRYELGNVSASSTVMTASTDSRYSCYHNIHTLQLLVVITATYLSSLMIDITNFVMSFQLPIPMTPTELSYRHNNNKYYDGYHNNNNRMFQLFDSTPSQQQEQQQPTNEKDNNNDDNHSSNDDDDENFRPTDLNQFMKNQFKSQQHQKGTTTTTTLNRAGYHHKQQQRYDPLMGYSLEHLEAFAASTSSSSQQQGQNGPKLPKYDTTDHAVSQDDDTDDDGIFLDPNEYIQSSRYRMTMDGTISSKSFNDGMDSSSSSSVSEFPLGIEATDPRYTMSIQGYVETVMTEPNIADSTNVYSPFMEDAGSPKSSSSTTYMMTPTVTTPTVDLTSDTSTGSRRRQSPSVSPPPKQQQLLQFDDPNTGYQTYDPYKKTRNNGINDDINDISSLDEIWTTISRLQSQQRNYDPTFVSEELHRQIFENEIGFVNQSSIFIESLTNTTKTSQANVERRGRFYRSRQEHAIQSLNEQISEFEATLLSQQEQEQQQRNGNNTTIETLTSYVLCTQCQCRLSEEEINNPGSKADTDGTDSICRICYMERLVSKSKRNDRDQHQARMSTGIYRQNGGLYNNHNNINNISPSYNSRRYTTQKPGNNIVTIQRQRNDSLTPHERDSRNDSILPPLSLNNEQTSINSKFSDDLLINGQHNESSNNHVMSEALRKKDTEKDGTMKQSITSIDGTQRQFDISVDDTNLPIAVSDSIHPWVEVMDPDTEEIFYWNEDTEEMRWEL